MTCGTCPLSFVTPIFYSGQPSLGGEHKTFNITKRNLWFSSFLLAATLYQRNPDRNNKLWNIVSTDIYILHMEVKIVSDPLSSFPVSIHHPFFLSPLVSFCSYHVTSKSLNNIHSYNGMYLPKFIQKKITWSAPISQIEQCTTTLIKPEAPRSL